MFPCVVAFVSSSLLAVQLFDLLSVLGKYDSFAATITSAPIQLHASANSVLAVASFVIISIFTIVLVSSASPPTRPSPHYCPVSVTAPDDINTFSYFPTPIKATSKPISAANAQQILSPPSTNASARHDSTLGPLVESGSEVTLTFGTDRPDVYLTMCEQQDMNTICHCSCNHKRPNLRKYPHINRLMSSLSRDTSSQSAFESDFDQSIPLDFATLDAGNTPAPSYHAIDINSLPEEAPPLQQVICAPSVQPNVCQISFPPANDVCSQIPVAIRTLALQQSVIPKHHAALLHELKKLIVAQFKLFELVVAFIAFMRTVVDQAFNHANIRRVSN